MWWCGVGRGDGGGSMMVSPRLAMVAVAGSSVVEELRPKRNIVRIAIFKTKQ